MHPLYAITTVFNPRRFASRPKLYGEFAGWLDSCGVRLLTVEMAFGDRPHAVTTNENPWHIQLYTKSELWHKERALNLGLQALCRLAPDWRHVAWMDADIRLARTDWHRECVHLLQHYAVVQMFGEARNLDPQHQTIWSTRSIARNFEEHGSVDWYANPGIKEVNPYVRAGHPGLAWAFRRQELNDVGGWLDVCVNGSGDLHMAGCYAGDWTLAGAGDTPSGYREAIRRYGQLCERHIRGNMSFMPGAADHYFHGRSSERGYEDRGRLIHKYRYNPATDLVAGLNGLHRWNLDDPRVRAMAVETRKSLAARNEDVNER